MIVTIQDGSRFAGLSASLVEREGSYSFLTGFDPETGEEFSGWFLSCDLSFSEAESDQIAEDAHINALADLYAIEDQWLEGYWEDRICGLYG